MSRRNHNSENGSPKILMKKLMLMGACVSLFSFVSTDAQVTLNQGEAYEYSFSALPDGPFQQNGPLFDGRGALQLGFTPGTIDTGDTIRFDFFEEGLGATADYTFTLDGSAPFFLSAADGLWADRDGSFRLTAVSGSFEIVGITAIRGDTGLFPPPVTSGTYQLFITPVPEPSSIALAALGGAFLFARRRSRH